MSGEERTLGCVDIDNPSSMAEFYGVTLEEYQRGQEWARENLPKLRGDTESDS